MQNFLFFQQLFTGGSNGEDPEPCRVGHTAVCRSITKNFILNYFDFSVSVNIQVIMKDIIFGLVAPCSASIKNIWQGTLLMKTKRIVMANWSLVTAIGKRRIYKEFFSSLVQRERMRSVNEEPQTCS